MLCRLNHDVMQGLFGERLDVALLDPKANPASSLAGLRDAARGYINGVNDAAIEEIVRRIGAEPEQATLFIDGSNLGALAQAVKLRLPAVEVISFFHNVEARFFLGAAIARKSLHSAAVLLANYVAERKAVRHSDKLVCLSERDSALLRRVYGRPATHVSPLAVRDTSPAVRDAADAAGKEPFALFVGGAFYANRRGLEWYTDHVAAHAGIKVLVVGRGLDAYRHRLEVPGRVEVVGEVDDLSFWYSRALFIIAPIFDGSGMKTKVAEALMYGKKVVGTPEAFTGYETSLPQAGWACTSADEFVRAMRQASSEARPGVDAGLRQLYLASYSEAAAQRRLNAIVTGAEQSA